MKNRERLTGKFGRVVAGVVACAAFGVGAAGGVREARADDLASVVARAREQVESGAFAEALRTLNTLSKSELPPTLAVEAGLLETAAALVTKGEGAGAQACAKAIVAAGYDPEIARDQSPKVRAACRTAAATARKERLVRAGVKLSDLEVEAPEVAWAPVRISASASAAPAWLRVVARVRSSALEGSFDLPLAPSPDGPLRGTLDPSFIRPKAKLDIAIVAQDKFGDLATTELTKELTVPTEEALVALGDVPGSASVLVDGKSVDPDESGHVPVEPGKHEVEMQVDGATSSAKVDVARGSVARVALAPQRGGGRTFAWIATGTAVVLGATGGVLLYTAASRTSEIEDLAAQREPGTSLPATDYADIAARDDERRTFQTVGMGLAIAGGAVGALALTLWLLPSGGGKKAPKKDALSSPVVVPFIGPGGAGLVGTF